MWLKRSFRAWRSFLPKDLSAQLLVSDAHAPLAQGDTLGHYRVALRAMDRALAEFEGALVARGYDATNTIWVFIGDHGEGLGSPQHHGPGHGRYLYPTTVSVPWIIADQACIAGDACRHCVASRCLSVFTDVGGQ